MIHTHTHPLVPFHPPPTLQTSFVTKYLREVDEAAIAEMRSRDPDHPLLLKLKRDRDEEREKDVYVFRIVLSWPSSGCIWDGIFSYT